MMTRFALLILAAHVGLSGSASAQPFAVVSSSPGNGAANIALVDTVSFTFSQPLVPADVQSIVALFLPIGEIEVDYANAHLSEDGLTVSYPVVHEQDTDYVAVVGSARSAMGKQLDLPYVVNYTTSESHGQHSVSGTVSVTSGDASPRGAIVGLVDALTGDVSSARVVAEHGGAYTVSPVRIGAYLALALRIPDIDAGEPFLYGFYDATGDGNPDPVIVLFGNPANVDIALRAPEPVTARHRLSAAVDAVADSAPDTELVAVYAAPVDTLGRSAMWVYEFHSISGAILTRVVPTDVITLTQVFDQAESPGQSINLEFVDSDAALETAEAHGGADFRAAFDEVAIAAAGRTSGEISDYSDPVWRVEYRASPEDSLVVYIDMASGEVVGPVSAEPPAASAAFMLEPPFPNPVGMAATIPFFLPEAGRATVRVFDLLGRELVTLVDGPLVTGRHEARWSPPPSLPNGVYVITLTTATGSASRRVILMR